MEHPISKPSIIKIAKLKWSKCTNSEYYQRELCEMKSIRQKNSHLEVHQIFLNTTVKFLRDYVQRMKDKLVLNLDEIGLPNLEDRRMKKVVVLSSLTSEIISSGG
jgi:hypothetical protein